LKAVPERSFVPLLSVALQRNATSRFATFICRTHSCSLAEIIEVLNGTPEEGLNSVPEGSPYQLLVIALEHIQ
jgi:hypothetical protein